MYPLDFPNSEADFRCNAVLPTLLEIVSLHREPGELLRDLASRLHTILPFDFVTLSIHDSLHGVIQSYRWDGAEWPREPFETAKNNSAAGLVWRTQSPVVIEDVLTESRFEDELRWLRGRNARSYCILPLTTAQEKLGVIGFASPRAKAFGPSDIQLLDRIASIVSLCYDSSLTEMTLRQEKSRRRLLFEVSSPCLQSRDTHQSIASILDSLQRWAPEDHVGIYLYDDASQSLRLHMADTEFAEKLAPRGFAPLEGSLAGQTFRSHHSLVLDHSRLSALSFASVKRAVELGIKCLYLAPILSSRGPLGVLKVARRKDDPFSPRDVELLEQVAAALVPVFERVNTAQVKESSHSPKLEESTAPALLALTERLISGSPAIDAGQLQFLGAPNVGTVAEFPKPTWFGVADAMLESEQLLTAYFKASRVGICILDTEFRYLALNETLAEMNGVPAPAHLGKTVREVLGDFDEMVRAEFSMVLTTGEPILNRELSYTLPTRGHLSYWIEHYLPIKNAAGGVVQIGVIAVEITEQKKLEESLRGVSETLRREKQRQRTLSELGKLLSASRDIRQSFPQISAHLRRIFRQEYAALILRDEKSGNFIQQALDFPLRKNSIPDGEVNPVEHPGNRVLKENVPVLLTRNEMRNLGSPVSDHLLSEGLKALCCVPLMRPKGALGILVLGSTRVDAFDANDLILLNQVADQLAITLENVETAREVTKLKNRLDQERRHLQGDAHHRLAFQGIIGESAALRKVLDQIAIVAQSEATVLLLGETGTGKGLAARALHQNSARKHRPFVTLNCAAIPTGLLESELFGHEKGAFTGAVNQKVGRVEAAEMGTLFLDEIGEIPPEIQPKLLRVLQDHEFERLGGVKTIRVDVRLVAATNRDLARSVQEKEFRSDLFYRLNVFPVRLPALRERREDIPILVRYFVRKYAARMGRVIETIPNETMDALMTWDWPGNVRELENFIERSVILSGGTALSVPLDELTSETLSGTQHSLENAEREHILQILRATGGVLSGPKGAAARLNIKRTTLQSKMERLGITRIDYEDPGAA